METQVNGFVFFSDFDSGNLAKVVPSASTSVVIPEKEDESKENISTEVYIKLL